jgi:regulator of PEP synthase PpsR (kinase-PPPase family)
MLQVFVVSDATGATAESVATSVLVQFRGAEWRMRRFPFTRSVEQVDAVVDEAAPGSVIVFTLVSRRLSEHLVRRSREKDVVALDVLSPLMKVFSASFDHAPSRTPGVFRRQTEDMFKVTEAIHYTLRHDDGGGLDTIDEADLVILGVSRTGKTPTSIYLSCRKLKVANVPIILDLPLPPEVARVASKKVGFRMDLDRLVALRGERLGQRRLRAVPRYSEGGHVAAETEYCERVFRAIPGLVTLDVTNRSIEETSDWITRHVL